MNTEDLKMNSEDLKTNTEDLKMNSEDLKTNPEDMKTNPEDKIRKKVLFFTIFLAKIVISESYSIVKKTSISSQKTLPKVRCLRKGCYYQ